MSDDQNIATNAQTTSDAQAAGDDVEGHIVMARGDDAAKGGPGQSEGFVRFRNDTPDAEDDVEGHVRVYRNDTPDGSPTEG